MKLTIVLILCATLHAQTSGLPAPSTLGNATTATTAAALSTPLVSVNIPKIDVLNASEFCLDAGSTDTYACSMAPAITAYVTGTHYRFKANTVNTGAASVNFNAVGAKTIVKVAGGITTALADGDIRSGQWVDLVYDGTNMQMQSTLGNAPSGSGLSSLTSPNSSVAIGGTLSAPTLDIDTTYTNGLYGQLAASNLHANGTKETFGLNSSTAGIRLTCGADPSTPSAGDLACSAVGAFKWYDGAAWNVAGTSTLSTAIRTWVKSFNIENPTTADSYLFMFEEGKAITLTRVACNVIGGTNLVINLRKTSEATSGSGGTAALTSNLTCTAGAFVASTTFTSAGVAARIPVALEIVSASGTNTFVHVQAEYTVD